MRLAGKVALITGGAGGMGSAQARLFAQEGAAFCVADIHTGKGQHVGDEINAAGGRALNTPLDVTRAEQWAEAVAQAEAAFGSLTILCNNAGANFRVSFDDQTEEMWHLIMETALTGAFLGIKAAVPAMRRAGGGSIINIGSIAGPYPSAGQPMYSASKAAIHIMSANLRLELFGTDVRVTELRPGRVRSGMHAEMFEGDHARAAELLYNPYECMNPGDVADVVRFVLAAPPHVCVAQIEVVPTHQVIGGTKMYQRTTAK